MLIQVLLTILKKFAKAKDVGAWVHIDGAFGLWAAANNTMSDLSKGLNWLILGIWMLTKH